MEEIDELVALTADDIKQLEAARFSSNTGCGISLLVIFLIVGILAFLTLEVSYWLLIILAIISVISLLGGILLLYGGPTENKDISLDLKEGNKRRIVAPIENKDMDDVTPGKNSISLKGQIRQSYKELEFKYYMTVKDWKFDLSEEQYLAGAKKGDFVEFFVAPHSNTILSEPVNIQE